MFYPHLTTAWYFYDTYIGTIDCVQSLLTASFSTLVLSLFVGAYFSLVVSIKQLQRTHN